MHIGIVGGGQLGRMLAMAGTALGMRCSFLDPHADACAGDTGHLICADYDDETALTALAAQSDLVTFEFESIPPATVNFIGERVPVFPSANALAVARDRAREKTSFEAAGIPVAPWRPIASQGE
ncbi:MAG: 5-(carboxyamino)imidazole ribonucleotide synthase, partial [Gammaproteobacteria bacterium]|nr:5-(carboxyamino)imidazole ribonucleotide synthase [Gammaproteobacteria bacterium]